MALKRKAVTLLATAALTAGAAAPAFAGVESRAGGTWNWGTDQYRVWSDYWHPTSKHGASVQGQYYDYSGCLAPNANAKSEAPQRPYQTDYSYYQFC